MKTTKRVFAIVLAALMLAMMVPFAASAATETVSFTLSYDTPSGEDAGTFEWTVYQLATLDTTTGKLTMVATNADIKDCLNDKNKNTAQLLAACDAATSGYGTANAHVFKSGDTDYTYNVTSGVYYVKCTKAPASATLKNNSIVALPYYQNNAWQRTLPQNASTEGNKIKLATKFSNSPTSIDKKVKDAQSTTETWGEATTQEQGKDVQFRTFVTTAGSATERLKSYRITDSMNNGLVLKSIDSVKFFADANSSSGTDVPTTAYTVTPATIAADTDAFVIAFNESYLTASTAPDFYNYKYIEVKYTCTVTKDAEVGNDKNVNTTTMFYKPISATDETPVGPDTAQVYVYKAGVFKFDAAKGENTPLANAEFGIWDNANCTGNPIAVAKTDSTGHAVFVKAGTTDEYKFAGKKYYVKETKQPDGYNLNSEIKEITLGGTVASEDVTEVSIGDTPAVLPQTGGEGTLMFTIIGGSLVVLAGVLFVVVMKKRKSSK